MEVIIVSVEVCSTMEVIIVNGEFYFYDNISIHAVAEPGLILTPG